jgi:hypothetical protein
LGHFEKYFTCRSADLNGFIYAEKMRNSGKLVETKNGEKGRTFDSKGFINGKIPVYLATVTKTMKDGFEYISEFSESAILCEPSSLKLIGYVD